MACGALRVRVQQVDACGCPGGPSTWMYERYARGVFLPTNAPGRKPSSSRSIFEVFADFWQTKVLRFSRVSCAGGWAILASIKYHGQFSGMITTAAALTGLVELALDRRGHSAPRPSACYAFSGRWRGAAAARRPRRFLFCAAGFYTDHRLHPLRRGVWEGFRLNVD
jgi:hypothetical protein